MITLKLVMIIEVLILDHFSLNRMRKELTIKETKIKVKNTQIKIIQKIVKTHMIQDLKLYLTSAEIQIHNQVVVNKIKLLVNIVQKLIITIMKE